WETYLKNDFYPFLLPKSYDDVESVAVENWRDFLKNEPFRVNVQNQLFITIVQDSVVQNQLANVLFRRIIERAHKMLLGIRFDIPNNIEVTDRVSDEFYSYFQDVAKQNTLIYEKVFATMKTQQTLKGIQGFVIEYLIYFLDKENYLPSMRTRE
ncbi:unnamed protein product, partial [Rotaria sp. Silwood1]